MLHQQRQTKQRLEEKSCRLSQDDGRHAKTRKIEQTHRDDAGHDDIENRGDRVNRRSLQQHHEDSRQRRRDRKRDHKAVQADGRRQCRIVKQKCREGVSHKTVEEKDREDVGPRKQHQIEKQHITAVAVIGSEIKPLQCVADRSLDRAQNESAADSKQSQDAKILRVEVDRIERNEQDVQRLAANTGRGVTHGEQ